MLDLIAGSEGRREQRTEYIEQSASQSYANQQEMRAAGLTPIPVFHRGENFKWLEQMLRDGETYVALAPLPWGTHRFEIMRWLHHCFSRLTDSNGRPLVKVHGLGVTSDRICHGFPWTSVDSRTWLIGPGTGQIQVPLYDEDDRPNYQHSPTTLAVTDGSRHHPNHLDKLGIIAFDEVRRFLEQEVGIAIEEARYSHRHRQIAWVKYQQALAANSATEIVFVADLTWQQNDVLARCNARRRLMSYYDLKDRPEQALADYVAGRFTKSAPRPAKIDWYSNTYTDARKLALFERIRSAGDNCAFLKAPTGIK